MREGAIIPRSSFSAYGANSVHMKTRQLNQPCLCLCLGSEQMTMTLPFLRMILHFSHIGFTDGRTFILVPPVADIFPQQIQALFERMLNYYSRIDTVFNKKFKAPRKFSRCLKLSENKAYAFGFFSPLQVILPRERSYGEISIVTLSPGRILM